MNKNEFKDNIRFILSSVLTTLLVIALIVLIFAQVGTSFKFDSSFWFKFGIGSILTVLIVMFWLPAGKEKGEKEENFKAIKKSYNNRADEVGTKQQNKQLSVFCKEKTKFDKKERIISILNNVVLDYSDYKNIVKNKKTKEDILASKDYTEKQKKTLIKLITKEVKVEHYNPAQVTTGIEKYKGNNLKNYEKLRQLFYVTTRILIGFATMFFLASFVVLQKEPNIADFAQLLMWLCTIATNLVGAYLYGIKLVVVYRSQYYLKLYNFLQEFDEWLEKPYYFNEEEENTTNLSSNTTTSQNEPILEEIDNVSIEYLNKDEEQCQSV